MNSLVHRGPDHQGIFETPTISLGATRLTILDIAAGDQPMSTADGRTTIAFNGEIYNYRELRGELEGLGHRFTTRTDTEVLLHAFVQWDTRCFARLRGMFAVALWSETHRRLVLARDRFGIKPLYFAKRGGNVYFGSELKTLFVHPEIDRQLDPASLDCYLGLNYVPGPGTFVEGIEKLTPGSWLEWRNGETRTENYWELPVPLPIAMDFEDAKQRLDALLESSVREHLIADVPLGLWLSGGIDSSTILHYAAGAAGRPINTFSVTFKGRSFDESSNINALVSHYGTRHEELDLNPELELRDAIEDFATYADEPNADAGALPVWYLSQMTRRSATVALSGEGADELFGGYVTYRANDLARWMRRLPGPLLGAISNVLRAWPASDEKISLEYKLKRFLEGCRMRPERAHTFWNGTFSDSEKQALVRRPMPAALDQFLAQLARAGDNQGAYLWFDQKYYLTDDILAKVDRMSMAHSIEVRPPFLDHRLAEFAATLPNRYKIDGSKQKVLLRSLMRDRLPSPILRHSKIGFDIPAQQWLRGPLRELMLDTLAWGAAEHGDLFQPGQVQACVDAHLARRANYGYHLWGLTILFLWMKRWRIRTAVTPAADLKMAAISS